jgi:hypothetical protein
MARPIQQTITCPSCRQPFGAIIEQVLDVGADPTAKERLLSGRVNRIRCPHCGYQTMLGTPLMYHDPSKQLAIIYVPLELNLEQHERERMIGDMANAVMRALPENAPKGYLLQPTTALTLQGMVDQVLEADGITREMIDAEHRKVQLVEQLMSASVDEADQLLAENAGLVDITFLELLGAAAQSLSQNGNSRGALRLLNIRTHLMETTEVGQQLKAQQDALVEASQELQALGEGITRAQFVDLIVRSAGNPTKVSALGTLGQTLLDYTTFQMLTERIDAARSEEDRHLLTEARELLLAIAAEYERQSRAIVERAVNTLKMLLEAPNIKAAIQANMDRIDETFLSVLQANLEEARRTGNIEISSRLKRVRDEVMAVIQAAAPPEIRLLNELLSVGTEAESLDILNRHSAELTPELLDMMEDLSGQLRMAGNEPAADRLDLLRAEAAKMI